MSGRGAGRPSVKPLQGHAAGQLLRRVNDAHAAAVLPSTLSRQTTACYETHGREVRAQGIPDKVCHRWPAPNCDRHALNARCGCRVRLVMQAPRQAAKMLTPPPQRRPRQIHDSCQIFAPQRPHPLSFSCWHYRRLHTCKSAYTVSGGRPWAQPKGRSHAGGRNSAAQAPAASGKNQRV